MKALGCLLLLCALGAGAEERITVCYNYGCYTQAEVVFSEAQLGEVARLLGAAHDAAEERAALGVAVGRLLAWAGQQSPIAADKGGNYADDAVHGKMDCIDHSTTTTRLLQMLERRGALHFHRVLARVERRRFFIMQHYSAQIEESAPAAAGADAARYVVDSWYFDNGQPAAVLPLAGWLAGEDPDGVE